MHLGFSSEYSRAIDKKAVQQQLAEMQKFVVLRDEELKNAQIIRSEAEAEAAKLINEAVKKYGATQIEMKKLEATLLIAQYLAKNPNISFVPSNLAGNLLNLQVWSYSWEYAIIPPYHWFILTPKRLNYKSNTLFR